MHPAPLTPDTILELRVDFDVPGFPRCFKGQRQTMAQWKEMFPFITDEGFGDRHFGRYFERETHPYVPVKVMADVYEQVIGEMKEPYTEALAALNKGERDGTDTTIRYAYRLAQDHLRAAILPALEGITPREDIEALLLDAWKKHHGSR